MADSGGVSRGDSKFMYSARRQPPASQRAFTASTPRRYSSWGGNSLVTSCAKQRSQPP